MLRVMTIQHHRIEYKMQVPGPARCLNDGRFALIKKLYRRCDYDIIGQRVKIIFIYKHSCLISSLTMEIVDTIPQTVKGIRMYQHFFNSDEPGIVSAQNISGRISENIATLKNRSSLLMILEDRLFFTRSDFRSLNCDTYFLI